MKAVRLLLTKMVSHSPSSWLGTQKPVPPARALGSGRRHMPVLASLGILLASLPRPSRRHRPLSKRAQLPPQRVARWHIRSRRKEDPFANASSGTCLRRTSSALISRRSSPSLLHSSESHGIRRSGRAVEVCGQLVMCVLRVRRLRPIIPDRVC
jgi:hypothetical protein